MRAVRTCVLLGLPGGHTATWQSGAPPCGRAQGQQLARPLISVSSVPGPVVGMALPLGDSLGAAVLSSGTGRRKGQGPEGHNQGLALC